ncbi:MAG TPA: hypothetical protein PLL41_01050 [Smithella sp.]|nr:hypothetical protein [Smithella sp.]
MIDIMIYSDALVDITDKNILFKNYSFFDRNRSVFFTTSKNCHQKTFRPDGQIPLSRNRGFPRLVCERF